jgi:hypothetical protein
MAAEYRLASDNHNVPHIGIASGCPDDVLKLMPHHKLQTFEK